MDMLDSDFYTQVDEEMVEDLPDKILNRLVADWMGEYGEWYVGSDSTIFYDPDLDRGEIFEKITTEPAYYKMHREPMHPDRPEHRSGMEGRDCFFAPAYACRVEKMVMPSYDHDNEGEYVVDRYRMTAFDADSTGRLMRALFDIDELVINMDRCEMAGVTSTADTVDRALAELAAIAWRRGIETNRLDLTTEE